MSGNEELGKYICQLFAPTPKNGCLKNPSYV
jgi:hypothetical protein